MSHQDLKPAKAVNREHWLELAVNNLRSDYFSPLGYVVPEVRVSIGFPKGNVRKAIGQFWPCEAVNDGKPQVFISPTLEEPLEILAVLVHELVHSVVPNAGHGKAFKKIALSVGLTGKMRATTAGAELKERLILLFKQLGQLPQSAINLGDPRLKKQTTRMIKCECSACGYIARTSLQWLETIGAPLCACNQEPMGVKQ